VASAAKSVLTTWQLPLAVSPMLFGNDQLELMRHTAASAPLATAMVPLSAAATAKLPINSRVTADCAGPDTQNDMRMQLFGLRKTYEPLYQSCIRKSPHLDRQIAGGRR
jgi:hypothetical protein